MLLSVAIQTAQHACVEHRFRLACLVVGLPELVRAADAVGKLGPTQIKAITRQNLALGIERQMIRVLRNQHVRNERGTDQSARDALY